MRKFLAFILSFSVFFFVFYTYSQKDTNVYSHDYFDTVQQAVQELGWTIQFPSPDYFDLEISRVFISRQGEFNTLEIEFTSKNSPNPYISLLIYRDNLGKLQADFDWQSLKIKELYTGYYGEYSKIKQLQWCDTHVCYQLYSSVVEKDQLILIANSFEPFIP